MIHNDPVGWPGLLALGIGGLVFAAALILAQRRRRGEVARAAVRSRRSLVGIGIQMLGILLVGLGPMRLVLSPGSPAALVQAGVVTALMAGVVALFWTATRAMGRNWSLVARTRADHELVETGPFAHIRHPIYTALALFVLALATAYGHLSHLWVAGPLYMLGTWFRVTEEERLLRSMFGARYDDYARRVKRFVPGLF